MQTFQVASPWHDAAIRDGFGRGWARVLTVQTDDASNTIRVNSPLRGSFVRSLHSQSDRSLLKIKTLHGDKPVTSDRFTHVALIAPLNFSRSDRRFESRHIASHGLLTFRRMVALLGSANLSRHG